MRYMATQTITRQKNIALQSIMAELAEIKLYLKKLLLAIPQESLKEYKNSAKIKGAYFKALKEFPPNL